jgi:hypothetical protein
MVSALLKSLSAQMKNHSATLDKTNILADKPWALIDEEFEIQKLIFKRNNELVLSRNGKVQIGSWEYFPEAKSLLIDRGGDKILCNEAFIDEGVMILKLDGTENNFFLFANENVIPDLDGIYYLKKLRKAHLNIREKEINDGRIIEIQQEYSFEGLCVGQKVTVDMIPIENGIYKLADEIIFIVVDNGVIMDFLYEKKYLNPEGIEISVRQQDRRSIFPGDKFYLNGVLVSSTSLNFSHSKIALLQNGALVKLRWKNKFIRFIAELFD